MMKTWTTRQGLTTRNPTGGLLDALRRCETAVLSEARAVLLPAERAARSKLAADLFTGYARQWCTQ